jgi:hypothetical protein
MATTVDVDDRRVDSSLRLLSRIGGTLYLIIIVLGIFGEVVVRGRVIVPNDATATAANLRSLESLWRVGIAAEVVLLICAVSLIPIFYILLRPVSRDLASLAVFFNLISIAVEAVAALNLVGTLFPLGNAGYLAAFQPEQLSALSTLAVRSHTYGFAVALIFFGCECVVLGYLIYRSGYLPRVIGAMMVIAGLCYVTNSFALLMAPNLASQLFPAILLPPFVGETSLCLWLLLKGVDVRKWKVRVGPPPMRPAAAKLAGIAVVSL